MPLKSSASGVSLVKAGKVVKAGDYECGLGTSSVRPKTKVD
jgi:hypothetical protein